MNATIRDALIRAGNGNWSSAVVITASKETASFVSNDGGSVLTLSPEDISALPELFVSKEAAIKNGIPVKLWHEAHPLVVHQFFPSIRDGIDVVFGRAGDASSGEGVAVVRLFETSEKPPLLSDTYVIVTYRFPMVSSLAVTQLLSFAQTTLRPLISPAART